MDKDTFEHEIRNASMGVALEVQRIRMAMQRLESHLRRMDQACKECTQIGENEKSLIDKI